MRATTARIVGSVLLAVAAMSTSSCSPDQSDSGDEPAVTEEVDDGVSDPGEIASGEQVDIQVFGNWRQPTVSTKPGKQPIVPMEGSEFVIVDLGITNRSQEPWDIMCRQNVAVRLVNNEGAEFDPISRMYDLEISRGLCNEPTNPGATMRTVWVFDVPVGAEVSEVTAEVWRMGEGTGDKAVSRLHPTGNQPSPSGEAPELDVPEDAEGAPPAPSDSPDMPTGDEVE